VAFGVRSLSVATGLDTPPSPRTWANRGPLAIPAHEAGLPDWLLDLIQ